MELNKSVNGPQSKPGGANNDYSSEQEAKFHDERISDDSITLGSDDYREFDDDIDEPLVDPLETFEEGNDTWYDDKATEREKYNLGMASDDNDQDENIKNIP